MEGPNNAGGGDGFMGFGDGGAGGGLSPLMIMPLQMTAAPPSEHNNLLLFPRPPAPPNTTTTTASNHRHHHNNNLLQVPPAIVDESESSSSSNSTNTIKAKIMSHPHYPRLLSAYVNCHKVGAPPEVVARLEEACTIGLSSGSAGAGGCSSSIDNNNNNSKSNSNGRGGGLGDDPALDQFMEAYCEMLTKYEEELSKPFKEAMLFLSRVESQFNSLSLASPSPLPSHLLGPGCSEPVERNGSSEDVDASENYIDPQAEDRELKGQLLRKYSGYLGSLKQEFLKKRKKGKLPKEARQQLLDWWSRHYKWPYPSESQKLALAESTGLDQKQINNWFINQRKRHWKPSEEMQFVVMDATHPHYYMDNGLGNPFSMDCGPALL